MTSKEEISFVPAESVEKGSTMKSRLLTLTVEPLILFYILPSTMNYLVTQNLFLEKSCRVNLAYNESVCNSIMESKRSGYSKHQEEAVHQLAAQMLTMKSLMHGTIPIILMLFIGSWSDKHGKRKPCILGPIIGELVAIVCLILNAVYLYEVPVILSSLAYCLPMAISGGWPCLFLGAYSYVTTVSGESDLTARIGGVNTIQNIAMVIGLGTGGIILNLFGFIGSYSTIFFMMLSSLVYGYYIIKERKQIIPEMEEEIENLEKTPRELVEDFFKCEHFLSTVTVSFSNFDINKRLRITGILALLVILNGPLQGEQSVVYLYAKLKFGWNEIDFSIFYAVQLIIQIFGKFFHCFQS
ncbi:hypothetical protein WA026_013010 [Henosepilachna vigintioctopunctata]|uniref:Proton-coupled folate transporter n=1 Tax=Henosepilachna vigintioctopunctata TaxID=420089 RepID=A0AAW1TMT2_9CUCU